MNLKEKRGQLNISFGMIFSLILIIVFIAFAFYAIKSLVNLQSTVQINQFTEDLQNDIDKIWKSIPETRTVSYNLPKKITFVCFQDDEIENLKFISSQIIRGKIIENIDIEKTISSQEEMCIENVNGKVSFKLIKEEGEVLIKIQK